MEYIRPNLVVTVTKELLCTYRNSMDGFGKKKGTRVLTIQEAQGLTAEGTVIVRTTAKLNLHDSIPYAAVAIARRTVSGRR
ncbi:hypothetical protein EVAR_80064_1 [Eumeta japonica]|uniref:Uncharacterized protein n=1 Tax=Eumeta variegata TaxID=151549 RepID=A0A4C1UCN7_EUMVA|nr:hypothetical protein EVAR_80064_1 [Eumeta japonica]